MSAAGRDGAQSGLAIRPLVREVGNDNALKGGKSLSNSPEQVVAAADGTLPDAASRFRLASRRSCL